MAPSRRCLVMGLDCATPQLLFDAWPDRLPTLRRLMDGGIYGRLESTIPPITAPAWMSMLSSKDPGQLGIYGFRNRKDYSYDRLAIATSLDVREPVLWDMLGSRGIECIAVGVPLTYPPKPINGHLVSCFLAPDTTVNYTHPPSLKAEIAEVVPAYQVDVKDFRTEDKRALLSQIYETTREHFRLLRHLMATKPWGFFMFVEMGVDRLYHAFWRYTDPAHRLFEPGNPFENVLLQYHTYLDEELSALLELAGDDALVLVASDHGARTMLGGVCINDWLIREGYLALRETPSQPTALKPAMTDWARTSAWAEGGYYGRVMINVQGREPQGRVPASDYERFRDELAARIAAIPDEAGRPLGTRVYKPEDVYRTVRNIPPDLIVYFGDLAWRSAGTVGNQSVHIFENDTGPDDANHSQEGLFVLSDPASAERGEVRGATIYDVAPTLLERLGFPIPHDMIGRPLHL